MKSRRLWFPWLIVCLACVMPLPAQTRSQPGVQLGAQTGAIISQGDGAVTIDAARLTNIIPIEAPWRFSPIDNPHCADPKFDDSTWPIIPPGSGHLLSAAHSPNERDGIGWARLRLHLSNRNDPLALLVEPASRTQFAIFINGVEIARTPDFATGLERRMYPLQVILPQGPDLLVAVHFLDPSGTVVRYFPLEQISIGGADSIGKLNDLSRYKEFESYWLFNVLVCLIFLAFVPVALILQLAQRNRSEYLWFAVFCFFTAIDVLYIGAKFMAVVPSGRLADNMSNLLDACVPISCLEFVAAFAITKNKAVVRTYQGLAFLVSLLAAFHPLRTLYLTFQPFENFGWFLIAGYLLLDAYRRGRKECGILLIPLMCVPLSSLLSQDHGPFPKLTGFLTHLHVRGVGIPLSSVALLVLLAGLLGVILYRFIRVSKDEQLAASELEAARTVQQLLIPSTSPATPGFLIESVYLPARQVGGDFFLILPAPDPRVDPSLLAVIGDVSGKGLQAAMVVSTIIGGLRMQLSRQPAEVLAHLNRALTGHVSGFATCCAVLLHPDGRALIANAGNPSPYLDGEELPTSPGLPLGLTPDIVYDETAFTLTPGARLTFVSDGVVEATSFPRKELFGFDRTRAISQQSAAAIAEAACAFGTGAPQADDITVLTIAFTSP